MSLPPCLLSAEGWFSVCVCFVIYTISFTSLGKKSIAHAWLFTGLTVLSPTDESVARLASVPSVSSSRRKRPPSLPPLKTVEDRLAALELNSTTIHPGMITLSCLQSTSESIRLWRHLDNASVCVVSCLFALALRWVLRWKQVLFQAPCCLDISCWEQWWESQQRPVPLLGLLAVMAFQSVWTLGYLSSLMPEGSSFRYPPSSYLTGLLLGLATLWVLHTPILLRTMDIPVTEALEELAVRLLLWSRVVGIRIQDEYFLLSRLMNMGRLLIAAFCASLGFVLADPLQGTIQTLMYRWHAGAASDNSVASTKTRTDQSSSSSVVERAYGHLVRYHITMAIMSLLCLPLLILLTYLSQPQQNNSDMPRLTVRTLAAWCFVWMMCTLVKPLLQSYLEQALPAVTIYLRQPKLEAGRIVYPFRNRFQRLLRTGSQLVTFPFCVITLLMVGQLCHVHSNMYPVAYGEPLLDKVTQASLAEWKQMQARNLAMSASNSTSLISYLSPTRANACGDTWGVPAPQAMKKLPLWSNVVSGRDLLEEAPPIPNTLVKLLGGMQSLAILAREDQVARSVLFHSNRLQVENIANPSDRARVKDTQDAMKEFRTVVSAVMTHPVLTSTVVLPIVDLLGFVLCVLWLVSLVGGMVSSRSAMRQLGSYHWAVAAKKNE